MPPNRVVKQLDVIKHISPPCVPIRVYLLPDPFTVEKLEEALSYCVVVTIPSATHAGDQAVTLEHRAPIVTRVLAALVRVNNDFTLGLAPP